MIFFFFSQQKTSWLISKGDADTRTNSPDLDSQALSHSSGTDRGPLQTMHADDLYSRECFFCFTAGAASVREGPCRHGDPQSQAEPRRLCLFIQNPGS